MQSNNTKPRFGPSRRFIKIATYLKIGGSSLLNSYERRVFWKKSLKNCKKSSNFQNTVLISEDFFLKKWLLKKSIICFLIIPVLYWLISVMQFEVWKFYLSFENFCEKLKFHLLRSSQFDYKYTITFLKNYLLIEQPICRDYFEKVKVLTFTLLFPIFFNFFYSFSTFFSIFKHFFYIPFFSIPFFSIFLTTATVSGEV